jgi:hypothetical protein
MNRSSIARHWPPSPQGKLTVAHDIREWLLCRAQQIRDDLTPRAPPGRRGLFERRLKAWSDGLPAADLEMNAANGSKGQVGYKKNLAKGTANYSWRGTTPE